MRKKAWILCTAMVVALAGCSNVSDNNTTESVTESNTADSTLQSEGSNTGKTEPAATEAKTTES